MVTKFVEYPLNERIYNFESINSEVHRSMKDIDRDSYIFAAARNKNINLSSSSSNSIASQLNSLLPCNDCNKYQNRETQHKNSYVQIYDHCGRAVHLGRKVQTSSDTSQHNALKNHKSTSTDTRAHFFNAIHSNNGNDINNNHSHNYYNYSRLTRLDNLETFGNAQKYHNKPGNRHPVKNMLYVSSNPSHASPSIKSVANTNASLLSTASPSIKLYVRSNIDDSESESCASLKLNNQNRVITIDDISPSSKGRLTVQTTSLDNMPSKQISLHPNGVESSNIIVQAHNNTGTGNGNTQNGILNKIDVDTHGYNANTKMVKHCKNDNEENISPPSICNQIQISSHKASGNLLSFISINNTINSKQVIKVIETIPAQRRVNSNSRCIPVAPPLPMSMNLTNNVTWQVNGSSSDSSIDHETATSFPWEKLDGEKIKGTVWEKCKLSLTEVNMEDLIDNYKPETSIIDLKNNGILHGSGAHTNSKYLKDKNKGRVYLKQKKAYNLAIILGGIKKPVAAIVNGLLELDDQTITPEVITHLLHYGPDEEEAKQLLSVSDPDILEKHDFLAYELLRLPMCTERLNAMLIRSTLDDRINHIRKSINAIMEASFTLKSSKNVKNLIELVLILGNWLNKNNPKYGKAHGFKVDVLKKLETMRIKSKQISVMNLLLRLTQKQFKMDPNMQNEIKIISTAASIDINHIDEEVKNIATCINKAESTVSSIKQLEQIESNEVFLRKMNDFLVESSEKMMKLKQENCRLKDSFADLRKYFGDDNKDTTSEEFFSTFKCFLTKFKG